MCKSEISRHIIEVIAKETEISEDEIKGKGKATEIVDARYLSAHFLMRCGFYPNEIARILDRTVQSVRGLIREFDSRRQQSGKIFEINYQRIRNNLENN